MTDEPRVAYFGEKWDAPITDDADEVPTPVGEPCITCGESFVMGDSGIRFANGPHAHRECSLRSVMGGIGHLVDHARYCRSDEGPDAGLSKRLSALLVWQMVVERREVTEDELAVYRAAS